MIKTKIGNIFVAIGNDLNSINLENNSNIIINDNDCSDTLFQMVCDKLREDGIIFQVTSNGVNIDQDNSTVITLDQQYEKIIESNEIDII